MVTRRMPAVAIKLMLCILIILASFFSLVAYHDGELNSLLNVCKQSLLIYLVNCYCFITLLSDLQRDAYRVRAEGLSRFDDVTS